MNRTEDAILLDLNRALRCELSAERRHSRRPTTRNLAAYRDATERSNSLYREHALCTEERS